MEREPKPGEFYRHFKNKLYQIMSVAEHTETGESLVIYQALYGSFKTYARPLTMFLSEVDRQKYPDAVQVYRFERVTMDMDQKEAGCVLVEEDVKPVTEQDADKDVLPNPYLLEFLDAGTHEKQMEALRHMKGKVGQQELDSICLVMDIPLDHALSEAGSVDEQIRMIEKHLSTRSRYDGLRLR